MQPLLRVYRGLVVVLRVYRGLVVVLLVVLRGGCGVIRGSKSIICDFDKYLG